MRSNSQWNFSLRRMFCVGIVCLFLLALSLINSEKTFAANSLDSPWANVSESATSPVWDNIRDPMGGIPFVYGALGAGDYSSVNGMFDGHQMNIRAGLSYYMPQRDWVFDGSVGLHHAKIDAVDSSLLSGVLEGAARYRFLAYWHAGPILNVFVGNGGTFGSDSALTGFFGAEVARDIPLESNILRISMRLMTDINVTDERANLLLLNFGWSFPVGRTSPAVIADLAEQRGISPSNRTKTESIVLEKPVYGQSIEKVAQIEKDSVRRAGPQDLYNVPEKPQSRRAKIEDLAVASLNQDANTVSRSKLSEKGKSANKNSEGDLARSLASETQDPSSASYSDVPMTNGRPQELNSGAIREDTGASSEVRSDSISASAAAPTREVNSGSADSNDESNDGAAAELRIKVADYGIGRVVPNEKQEKNLEILAQALAQNRHLFEKIEVIGHADSNGRKGNLKKVAEYRARSVLEMFAKAGIPRSVLTSKGLGDTDTLGDEKWQRLNGRNRRVELAFSGVHSPKELRRLVERITGE